MWILNKCNECTEQFVTKGDLDEPLCPSCGVQDCSEIGEVEVTNQGEMKHEIN